MYWKHLHTISFHVFVPSLSASSRKAFLAQLFQLNVAKQRRRRERKKNENELRELTTKSTQNKMTRKRFDVRGRRQREKPVNKVFRRDDRQTQAAKWHSPPFCIAIFAVYQAKKKNERNEISWSTWASSGRHCSARNITKMPPLSPSSIDSQNANTFHFFPCRFATWKIYECNAFTYEHFFSIAVAYVFFVTRFSPATTNFAICRRCQSEHRIVNRKWNCAPVCVCATVVVIVSSCDVSVGKW